MLSRLSLCLLSLFLLSACVSSQDMEDYSSPGAGMARLGRHLQEKGDIGGAIDFYRRALVADPENRMAIQGLTSALENWGDKEGAAELYARSVQERPDDIALRLGYGKLLIALDRAAEAKEQFKAALSIDDDDLKARVGLGIALDYLGDHRAAQKQYEKILDDEPSNLSAINNLAYSYILTRRYDKAIKLLEPQYKKPAATAALRQNLALAYGLSGMDIDAERVGRMDLSSEKVAQNMDYYRRKRAEMSVDKAPYAELGTYATEAMAVARIQKLKQEVGPLKGDLRPVVFPEVAAPGGTPRFAVRMMGCSRPDDISRLCELLGKSGIPCTPRGRDGE